MRLTKPETCNLKELEKCLCEIEGGMRLDVLYDTVQLSGFHHGYPSFYHLDPVHTSVPRNLAYRVTSNNGLLLDRMYEHSIYTPM